MNTTPLIPCFIYKEGVHFTLPPELQHIKCEPSMFAVMGQGGVLVPAGGVFTETCNTAEAEVFLFPYDIGSFIDIGRGEYIQAVIENLPFYRGNEQRHFVSDFADSVYSVNCALNLFKVSVTKSSVYAGSCTVVSYNVPTHVLSQKPDFCWQNAKYDCCFVGANSHFSRQAAVISVKKEAPDLRFFANIQECVVIQKNSFYLKQSSEQEQEERKQLFVNSICNSVTVLCPPGMGPQSIRMYESMYLGRIPVLFDYEQLYPFANEIDYASFALIIPAGDIAHTGNWLQNWFKNSTAQEITQRCTTAAKVFHKYFAPQVRLKNYATAGLKKIN